MTDAPPDVCSVEELRRYVHRTLCDKEDLIPDQFCLTETRLIRRGRACGLQFVLRGPRNVRLGAVWASDHNVIYFYDARGERYKKVWIRQRLHTDKQRVA